MSIIFSPRNGKLALAITAVTGGAVLAIGDPFLMVFASPILGAALSLALVSAVLPWLLGPARRGYLHGTGRQACWAYLGHTIRGDWDDVGQLWISLTDCHHASGLDLLGRLDRVANADKRKDGAKGWVLTDKGMTLLLANLRGDPFPIHKLRLFLEREVWQARRG
ncbi:MAG: hypothetical protein KKF85_17030 [Gammaproteobacteria bacterium]|nr:hypothetical protein [Rhodocyclaceae bacterium]MBU3910899.1 hypothetical protein [Gammaproteobacteria bacterium]MBU3988155.1 hypothetical protein [Gammaproteobacteria bacterium]MBU4006353.1 hypothetical protein [Gammaproteobacteria bacterium]MBU4097960.1 hypothetical protein [Gammaproteobacteria bacterium]